MMHVMADISSIERLAIHCQIVKQLLWSRLIESSVHCHAYDMVVCH